jgi:hypothetical protein
MSKMYNNFILPYKTQQATLCTPHFSVDQHHFTCSSLTYITTQHVPHQRYQLSPFIKFF